MTPVCVIVMQPASMILPTTNTLMQISWVCSSANRSGKPHLGRQLGVPPRVAALSAATAATLQRTIRWIVRLRFALAASAANVPLAPLPPPSLTPPSIGEACHWHPVTDWSALAAWQMSTAGIALVTSRFPGTHLPLLTVIARCTNVLTNAPSAPLLTCSILPCAWRSGVCSPTSARLLRVGLPALKARHRPGS